MPFGKIDRIVLFIIAALLVVCVYFLFMNKKDTADQSSLLVAMAKKLDSSEDNKKPVGSKPAAAVKEKAAPLPEISLEDKEQIIAIADKLCFNKYLSNEEKIFKTQYSAEIATESVSSKLLLSSIIHKFIEGNIDFSEEEKEFYDSNQADIDAMVSDNKYFYSVINKITAGITDFTEGELQYQANNPKIIETELARLKLLESRGSNAASASSNTTNGNELKGAAPPITGDEFLKTILSFFEDKTPKTVTEISQLYADLTKSNLNKGGIGRKLGALEDKGQLKFITGKGGKIYYGPPEWFVGNKLKTEFCPPEWLDGEKLKDEFKNKIAKQ